MKNIIESFGYFVPLCPQENQESQDQFNYEIQSTLDSPNLHVKFEKCIENNRVIENYMVLTGAHLKNRKNTVYIKRLQ